ncbi:MAG: hypothetical protein ACRCUM_00405 [Mycoplasmoidaceae bacterium]
MIPHQNKEYLLICIRVCLRLHINDTAPKLFNCSSIISKDLRLHINDTAPKLQVMLLLHQLRLRLHINDTTPKYLGHI